MCAAVPVPSPSPMDGNWNYSDYTNEVDSSSARHAATPRLRRLRSSSTPSDNLGPSGAQTSRPRAARSNRRQQDTSHSRQRSPSPLNSGTDDFLRSTFPTIYESTADSGSQHHTTPRESHGGTSSHPLTQYSHYDPSLDVRHNVDDVYSTQNELIAAIDGSLGYFPTVDQQYPHVLSSSQHDGQHQQADAYFNRYLQAMHLGSSSQTSLQQSSDDDTPLQMPDTSRAYQYVPPEEYELLVVNTFPYMNIFDLVYSNLDDDQKFYIFDRIQQIRPYSGDAIRHTLQRHMTALLAMDFLSGDKDTMDRATQSLFPVEQQKERTDYVSWMTGFTDDQRRLVMKKFAAATGQRTDELLELFEREKITPAVAEKILYSTLDGCRDLAEEMNLYAPPEKPRSQKSAPWMKGASSRQRKAVLQRLLLFGHAKDKVQAHYLLKKEKVRAGFGLKILQANEHDFLIIVAWLKKMIKELPQHLQP
ncbi:hypothetical protein CBS101457_000098 [Exobasidium rhododendri]|nr:hypothetical protein CBS101457_000098 [Exobasidium rhododendri]